MKSFSSYPKKLVIGVQAVCTLKQEKPDWDTAKKLLGDGFMKGLIEFDKDNIPDTVIKRLKKYIENPEYTPETVGKQSRAAMSLCMWTRAMDVYHRIIKVVEPKRAKLKEVEAALNEANAVLQEKQASLQVRLCLYSV